GRLVWRHGAAPDAAVRARGSGCAGALGGGRREPASESHHPAAARRHARAACKRVQLALTADAQRRVVATTTVLSPVLNGTAHAGRAERSSPPGCGRPGDASQRCTSSGPVPVSSRSTVTPSAPVVVQT